jgi:hypothetical protein
MFLVAVALAFTVAGTYIGRDLSDGDGDPDRGRADPRSGAVAPEAAPVDLRGAATARLVVARSAR